MLLELFKYIIEEPESSQYLVEMSRVIDTREPELIEGLVF